MRIKYKGPNQFFFRRFWRVKSWAYKPDGELVAVNVAGKKISIPAGMVIIFVGL